MNYKLALIEALFSECWVESSDHADGCDVIVKSDPVPETKIEYLMFTINQDSDDISGKYSIARTTEEFEIKGVLTDSSLKINDCEVSSWCNLEKALFRDL